MKKVFLTLFFSFTADTLQSHHAKCPRFPVPCPFRCGLKSEIVREEIEGHLKTCPLANGKNCVYQEAGCRFRGTPSKMEEHMNNARQIHLDLMCSLAHKQQDTIKKLNEQIEKSTTSYNGVLVWKIKVSVKSNYVRLGSTRCAGTS